MVWAAAHRESPGYDALQHRPYVEFHAHPQHELDIGGMWGRHGHGPERPEDKEALAKHVEGMYGYKSHATMRGDVPPSRIMAVHEPWHSHVRYLESDPHTLHDYTQGDFKDYDTGDPHTDRALAYVRAKHAAGGYK
jgi:hypothetical protein